MPNKYIQYAAGNTNHYNYQCRCYTNKDTKAEHQPKLYRHIVKREIDAIREDLVPKKKLHPGAPPPNLPPYIDVARLCQPSADESGRIYQTLTQVSAVQAARNGFWAHVTMHHLETNQLDLRELANEYQPPNPDEGPSEHTNTTVRKFLHNLGGTFPVRGYNSIMQDCPLGRIYWRETWLREMQEHHELPSNFTADMHVTLTQNPIWHPITEAIIGRPGIFGHPIPRGAMLIAIHTWYDHHYNQGDLREETRNTLRRIAQSFSPYETSAMRPDDVCRRAHEALG